VKNVEQGPLDRALFLHDKRLVELEQRLYGHVFDAVDVGKLCGLEQMLWFLLDELDIPDDLQGDLARLMIARALARVGEDAQRSFSTVPFGITKEEAAAVAFDDACPFCKVEAQDHARRAESPDEDADDDDCPCCNDLARQWREEHAEALARVRPGDRSS
jgi:hypothetical protein